MATDEKGAAKFLLIGCGGSGLKTLTRLNGLLASNAKVREDMAENISYFVIDTDQGDLRTFRKMVDLQMGQSRKPNISTLHISEGYQQLNEIVGPKFNHLDKERTALMKKYWWYRNDTPFRAVDVDEMENGAGQCGQISFLTTWNCLPQIETELSDLLQEIRSNDKNSINPLANLRVYLVAGIAGGTGRGSWMIVAYKIRELLLKWGLNVPLESVLFDATCYPNVLQGDVEQRRNLCINSCTAISELSALIRMNKSNAELFTLPSLDNPSPDHVNDLINFSEFKEKYPKLGSPVRAAYVVFGGNGSTARLEGNQQYHDMAASALYAQIVNSNDIAAKKSNDRSNIGSFASTTFEVDSVSIQQYLTTAVQKAFLEKQCAEDNGDLAQEIKVGSADKPEEDSWLGMTHLWIPAKLTFDGSYCCTDTKSSLLQKMMEAFGNDDDLQLGMNPEENTKVVELDLTKNLRDALADQDPENVKTAVDNALSLEDLDENKIKSIFNQILAAGKLDGGNLAKTLRDLVVAQFAPEGKLPSLRRAMLFTDMLLKAFSRYGAKLSEDVVVDGTSYKEITALVEAFNADVQAKSGRTFKEAVTFGKPFNDDEIAELCAKFQYFARAAVLLKIKKTLRKFFDESVKILESIQKRFEQMCGLLQEASRRLDGNLKDMFGDASFDAIFDDLFTDAADPDAIMRAIPSATNLKNLYSRKLKPILGGIDEDGKVIAGRVALNRMLTDRDNFAATVKPIMRCISEELQNLLDLEMKVKDRKYENDLDAEDVVPNKVRKVIEQNVFLSVDSSGRSFIDRYFSFDEVLDANIKAWDKLLSETSPTQIGTLTDKFREYLGITASDYKTDGRSGMPTRIDKEKLIFRMVRSLAVNCNPWIELLPAGQTQQALTCLVVLPFKIDAELENALSTEISNLYKAQKYTLKLQIQHPGNSLTANIPSDRILVYNAELLGEIAADGSEDGAPIERIRSMEYWRDYLDLLVLAEDSQHNCAALFREDGQEKSRGFAYLAPFFTEEPYRSLRWHPWLKDDVDQAKATLDDVYKALFYGFLGHAVDESRIARAKEEIQKLNCSMPLLEMGKDDQTELFYFRRKLLKWDGSKMDDRSSDSPWEKNGDLERSIDHVIEFLNGKGAAAFREDEGKKFGDSVTLGNNVRCAILREAESFAGNIKNRIGLSNYKELVIECCLWIENKCKTSRGRKDKECWETLLKFAKSERDKQQ